MIRKRPKHPFNKLQGQQAAGSGLAIRRPIALVSHESKSLRHLLLYSDNDMTDFHSLGLEPVYYSVVFE